MTDQPTNGYFAVIGTYTHGASEGIYVCEMDPKSGNLSNVSSVGGVKNPTFIAIHPTNSYLYAISEVIELSDPRAGHVVAYAINRGTGQLTKINETSSVGSGPCHISVDQTGKFALVANFQSGSVAVIPINNDGAVGEATDFVQHVGSSVNPERQTGPHAHSINLDPGNCHAVVADLGLDQVIIYRFDPIRGTLSANDPFVYKSAAGAGPRHFDFHPNGRYAYLINEIGNTLTGFNYVSETGALETIGTKSTLPDDFTGTSHTADIHVSPSGKYVYGSNRGHDSIIIFEINQSDGSFRLVDVESTLGRVPRNFAIDPSGSFLYAANQDTSDIFTFRINPINGRLKPTGNVVHVPNPVCIKFVPKM